MKSFGNTGFGSSLSSGFGTTNQSTGFGSGNTSGFGTGQNLGFGSTQGFGNAANTQPSTGFGSTTQFGNTQSSAFGGGQNVGFGSSNSFGTGFGSVTSTPLALANGINQQQQSSMSKNINFGGTSAGTGSTFSLSAFGGGGGSSFGGTQTLPLSSFGNSSGQSSFGNLGGMGAASGLQQSQFTPSSVSTINNDQAAITQKILEFQLAYAVHIDGNRRAVIDEAAATNTAVAANPSCEFDAIFYNYKNGMPQTSQRPPQIGHQRWLQAVRDNPDSNNYEPIVLSGATALRSRLKSQQDATVDLETVSQEVSKTVNLSKDAIHKIKQRLELMKSTQALQRHKLLLVMRKIEILRCNGRPLDPNEISFKERIGALSYDMKYSQTTLKRLILVHDQLSLENDSCFGSSDKSIDDRMDSSDLLTLYAVLKKQQAGLQHLTDIVKKDCRDMEIIQQMISEQLQSPNPIGLDVFRLNLQRIG